MVGLARADTAAASTDEAGPGEVSAAAEVDVRLGVGLALLLAVAVGVLSWARIPRRTGVVTASLRAIVQLTVIGLALRGVFAAPLASIAVLAVMLTAAVVTASRRLAGFVAATRRVTVSCLLGAGVTVGLIFAVGAVSPTVRTLVALAGSIVGGTMTACTLTGRRLDDGLRRRWDEVEAWLALGAPPRRAVVDIARDSVAEALVPALDQTRTVGLVTLPGTFVGALLGGASPAGAARFQVVVLVGLLCAQSIAAVSLAWQLGAPTRRPGADTDQTDQEATGSSTKTGITRSVLRW
ncbi:ABC transporter permease [Frankia sp. R82]|uniref:ABC transporter permease n=1 Tax=Frankia sp. R82 TaxID=2950553 RepID=UPI002044093C|nr:ABC transporter permease [Frankia sp. R82]MCM3882598.1 ABC transporter permease [Frankia sp. R82]